MRAAYRSPLGTVLQAFLSAGFGPPGFWPPHSGRQARLRRGPGRLRSAGQPREKASQAANHRQPGSVLEPRPFRSNPPVLRRQPGTRGAHRALRQRQPLGHSRGWHSLAGQPRRLRSPQSASRRAKVTSFSKQANSLILVREPTWTIGCRDENRSAKGRASNVAGPEIEGGRTAVLFRPPAKGGCVARGAPGLDR